MSVNKKLLAELGLIESGLPSRFDLQFKIQGFLIRDPELTDEIDRVTFRVLVAFAITMASTDFPVLFGSSLITLTFNMPRYLLR